MAAQRVSQWQWIVFRIVLMHNTPLSQKNAGREVMKMEVKMALLTQTQPKPESSIKFHNGNG